MRHLALALIFLIFAAPAFAYTYPKEMEQPWNHSPIKFFVNKSFPPECDPYYEKDFRDAIKYWESGGNGKLSFIPKFEEVSETGKPDITVQWVSSVQNVSQEVGGITYLSVIPNKRFALARILLACTGIFQLKDRDITKEFSHREMKTTSMHEIGHGLGLDHSDDPADIMTPRQTIQVFPLGFEVSSYQISLNISPRRVMPNDNVRLFGKGPANAKLDFIELYNRSEAHFKQARVTTDAAGFFENSVVFDSAGRYLVEVFNPLSPNVYASAIIFSDGEANIFVNSEVPARLYINKTFYGIAPKKVENLRYGDYEISCEIAGYRDYKTFLSVGPGITDELKAEPSRDAVLCSNEKISEPVLEEKKGFFEKLSLAIKEFFRILFVKD